MKPKTTIYVNETENDVLKSIAKDLNMTARRGQNTGEASVSRLNQGIASGEIICTLAKVVEPQGPIHSELRFYERVDRKKLRLAIDSLYGLGIRAIAYEQTASEFGGAIDIELLLTQHDHLFANMPKEHVGMELAITDVINEISSQIDWVGLTGKELVGKFDHMSHKAISDEISEINN